MNTRNRSAKKHHVDNLAQEVEAGEFLLTASGVGVSCNGELLDGQHRLMAIRKAGYPPVQFVLVTGLSVASQRVVDRHSRRTLGDALTLHMNQTISGHMVALANSLFHFGGTLGKDEPFRFYKSHAPDSLIADFMAEHNDLCAEVVQTCAVRAPIMAAIFVYAYHDRENALRFARDVSKGVELKEDSAAYRLRLTSERLKRASDHSGRMELFSCAASACIADSQRRPVKLLRPVTSWSPASWNWAIPPGGFFDAVAP
jgi:hypothetical protein